VDEQVPELTDIAMLVTPRRSLDGRRQLQRIKAWHRNEAMHGSAWCTR
jgi:hypothetical protein